MTQVQSASLFGDAVHTLLAPEATTAGVAELLSRSGLAVLDTDEIEPSLEDVFIHLVGAADE